MLQNTTKEVFNNNLDFAIQIETKLCKNIKQKLPFMNRKF